MRHQLSLVFRVFGFSFSFCIKKKKNSLQKVGISAKARSGLIPKVIFEIRARQQLLPGEQVLAGRVRKRGKILPTGTGFPPISTRAFVLICSACVLFIYRRTHVPVYCGDKSIRFANTKTQVVIDV